jgi:DNA topoisomerase-1
MIDEKTMNKILSSDSDDLAKELKAISLRYASDDIPGISRQKKGDGFIYKKNNEVIKDPAVNERIEKLRIPPAWEHVWISPTANGHIQATGRDEKGRKQYIYHEDWNKLMQENKFNKMVFFGEVLPEIRREIAAGMEERGLTERRVVATVIWLLSKTYIRVGNEAYAVENQSYGLTTMRRKHVDVSGDTVSFEFKGKSGKFHAVSIEHPKVARTIKKLEALPGYELFQYIDAEGNRRTVDSGEINEFLKKITGEEITAKDFRTWGGTVYAAENLYNEGPFTSKTEAKQKISSAVKSVSKHLGNTTAVCRAYYIHPTVIATYEKQNLIPYFEKWQKDFTSGRRLSKQEFLVHRLIQV